MTAPKDQKVLVEADSRGRVSLTKLPHVKAGTRYLAREESDGTIIMEPAVVLSAVTGKEAQP